MEQNSSINLFKSDIRMSPGVAAISGKLRTAGIIAISASIIFGVLIGSLALGLRLRLSDLVFQKDQATRVLQSLASRESLLLSIKDRANMAISIMKVQAHFGSVIDTVNRIAPGKWLTEFLVSDTGEVTLDVAIDSVEQAIDVLSAATLEARQGHIVNVILNSLKVDPDGKVKLSFGFVPIL